MQPYYQREGEYRSVRLRAVRKDGDSERRGGKEVSEEARQWNRYIIVATSPGEEVSAERVLELYRMKWQIELAFKRLRTLFQYGSIPAQRDGPVCETMANRGCFPSCEDGDGNGARGAEDTAKFVERIIGGAEGDNGSVA
jgi:hypothetical protein